MPEVGAGFGYISEGILINPFYDLGMAVLDGGIREGRRSRAGYGANNTKEWWFWPDSAGGNQKLPKRNYVGGWRI